MHALRIVSTTVPEDEEIKSIARKDRRAAADLVVRKYRDRLFHHASYILKDYNLALDVTQDVFIKAMREERFFDDEFKMKAWLFRVTSNLCFNIRRDKKRRAAILETVQTPTSSAADQVDLVFTNEAQESILAALDRLSENHRKILMLRYYSDLSYAEIAEALDIKLGTVMSRLSRAKSQLVDVLDDVREIEA
ncbi:MAG: RNA polymerase sigma factor [Alphaproteobacteria bacterium]|nr:RNA polymerase sigma factor [Alphaproteobacteria bacterium]MCB9694092.1 RNA polymerase sigma factor [Alphaproteobacteria bacterium]